MYRTITVNRKTWIQANSVTNVLGILRKTGLDSVNDLGQHSLTVDLTFDLDAVYSIKSLVNESYGTYLIAMMLRDFDVEFMLDKIKERGNHEFYLFNKAPNVPASQLVTFQCSNLLNPSHNFDAFEKSLEYVTELYPDSYDMRFENRTIDFYVILSESSMKELEEEVSFWVLQNRVDEELTNVIINKVPFGQGTT
jgi:hypothetical protein